MCAWNFGRSNLLLLIATIVGAFAAFPNPLWAAATSAPVAETAARDDLSIDVNAVNRPWTGDLDAMVKRRVIRVLVVPSKTFYFVNKGVQRGATYDFVRQFEDDLNKKLAAQKKLSQKNLKVKVFFVPVGREGVIAALNAGKGDIAAAALTITDRGKKLVDYSVPVYPDINEVVVAAPGVPAIKTLEDLSGKVVYVRPSSSYRESLLALNQRFAAQKRAPVVIKNASENLEDEDLIEMMSAGLIPLTIINAPIANFWKQVFPQSPSTTTLRCGLAAILHGLCARAARSSRLLWTTSSPVTARARRSATRFWHAT